MYFCVFPVSEAEVVTKAVNANVEDREVIGEDREDGEEHAAVVDMDSSTTRVVVVVAAAASVEGDRIKMPQLMQ